MGYTYIAPWKRGGTSLTGGGSAFQLSTPSVRNQTTAGVRYSLPKTQQPSGFRSLKAPQRIDLSEGAIRAIAFGAELPGRIYETPLSLVNVATGGGADPDEKGLVDHIVNAPVIGPALQGLGSGLQWMGETASRVFNSANVDFLAKHADLPDDTLVARLDRGILGFFGPKIPEDLTIGMLREDAFARGITPEDIEGVRRGRKSSWDFGDRPFTQNVGVQLAMSVIFDPTNVVFFTGLGTPIKVASWAGRTTGVSTKLGRVAQSAGRLPALQQAGMKLRQAPDAIVSSQMFLAGGQAWTTLKGIGTAIDRVTRKVPVVGRPTAAYGRYVLDPRGYTSRRRVVGRLIAGNAGLAAANAGLSALDEVDAPVADGFIAGLRELSDDILNDRPLSTNSAWNFVAAFHIPVRAVGRDYIRAAKFGSTEAFGTDFRVAFAKALTPVRRGGVGRSLTGTDIDIPASIRKLEQTMGGAARLDELIDFVADKYAFQKMSPVVRGHYASSDQAIQRHATLHDAIHETRDALFDEGRISGRDLVETFKGWYSNQGGFEGTGVAFQWDPELALEAWNRYRSVVTPVAKAFHENLDVVVGRNELLTKENVDDIIRAFEAMADGNRTVALRDVRRVLLKVPQIVSREAPDRTWWKSLGLTSAPERIKLRDLRRRMVVMKRNLPSDKELFADIADYEAGAPVIPEDPKGTITDIGVKEPRHLPGEASIAVSRMRPYIWRSATNYEEILFLRGKPVIREAEVNAGRVLRESGFRVDAVQQQVGGWQGTLEPSVQVQFHAGANAEELRMAGALLAKAWDQEASAVWITGQTRMREAGVKSNGYVVQITGVTRDQMHEAVRQTRALFGGEFEGFSLNDTAGTITFLFPDEFGGVSKETLRRLKQIQGAIGRPARMETLRRGYIEFIETKKAGSNAADAIVRRNRRDSRVQAFLAAERSGAFGGRRRVRRVAGASGRRGRGVRGRGRGVSEPAVEAGVLRLDDRRSAEPVLAALRNEQVVDKQAVWDTWNRFDPDALPEGDIEADMLRLADAGYDVADVRRMLDQYQATGNVRFWRQALNELSIARNSNDAATAMWRRYSDLEPINKRRIPAFRRELDELDQLGYDTDAVRIALDDFEEATRKTAEWEDAWERVTVALDAIPEKPAADPFPADLDGLDLQDELLKQGRPKIHEIARQLGINEIEEVVPTRGVMRYGLDSTDVLDTIDSLKATVGPDGKPVPGQEAEYQSLVDQLEGMINAERDRMSGINPGDEIGQELYNRVRDLSPIVRPVRLHQSLSEVLPDDKAMLEQWERWLRDAGLTYTLKKSPTLGTMLRDDDGLWSAALRQRTQVGHWLFDYGPISKMTGFMSWLLRPVQNQELGKQARQALYNELLPKHASVAQVDAFIEALKNESAGHSFKIPGGPRIHLFRGPQALLPAHINSIAAGRAAAGGEHLDELAGIFSRKTIEAIGPNNFHRVLDRAANRFVRRVTQAPKGRKPGAPMRALVGAYDFWSGTPMGAATRIVAKTFYPLFRFTADPRWLFLNALEADILGLSRDGLRATATFGGAGKIEPSDATKLHALTRPVDAFDDQFLDSSFLWNRNLAGHVSRSFDHRRPASTIEVLDEIEKTPMFEELKSRFGTDDKMSLADHLDQMLYDWDTIGTRATLDEALLVEVSKGTISHQDIEAMRPLLEQLWRRHEDLYLDIVKMYRGSAERPNIERILNSYWLYWPISYQIKASKWLFDLLSDTAFGRQTNLGGAAWLDEQRKRHERRLVQDENYRNEFARLPTSWFAAQMLLPVTPYDMGVSLNRASRFAGSVLGLWEVDERLSDPLSLTSALAVMGPIYTAELLERIGRDIESGAKEAEEEEFDLPVTPAPLVPMVAPTAPPAP